MAKRMLIDTAHPEEIRVAVLKGNRLEEFDFETATKKPLKGNIYLAKVTRVEPSLQAAFVDYGGNRHGFLAFNEIHPDYYRIPIADREALIEQEKVLAERNAESQGGERSDGAEVEVIGGDDFEEVSPRRFRPPRPYKIQEVTKRRQIMLVQVVKEERGNKGAALTTYLSLAGRYCVLMPNTPRGGGISRKITNLKDRRRLKSILEEFEVPDGMSVIVRTAGMERSRAEIKRDLEYLMRLWDEIRELTLNSTAPALIYEEANLIKRAIRDLYDRDIDEIQVEGEEGYRAAKEFMRMLTPSHAKRVQQYKDDLIPLFHRFQVESQIDAIHSPAINLKSGGYIVITPTEALVSVDVNSGRATRERNIEETALRTNSEAAEEIARQLRLRDLAGLVVIDFIDMEEPRNNATVERKLKEAMRVDRARIQIGRISPFGLLELSRQRLRPSLIEATMQHCVYCGGSGWVRSIESTALHVLRGLEEEGFRQRSAELRLIVPSAVALYLLNQKRAALAEVERRYQFTVQVDTDNSLIAPAYRLERLKIMEAGKPVPVPVSHDRIAATAEPMPAETIEAPDEGIEDIEVSRDEVGISEGHPPSPHPSDQYPMDQAPRSEHLGGGQPEGEGRRRRRRRRRRRGKGQAQPGIPQGIGIEPSPPGSTPYEPTPEERPGGAALAETEPRTEDRESGTSSPPLSASDGESEGHRRRARGRRGGRRRRRGGDRPQVEAPAGEFPVRTGTSEASISPMETPALPVGSSAEEAEISPAVPEWMESHESSAEAHEVEAGRHRKTRQSRRHEDAGGASGETVPAETAAPPMSEKPHEPPAGPGTEADAPPSTEREAPSVPVISVDGGTGERLPKKRGWWKRLSD